jgi:hypothetical protein
MDFRFDVEFLQEADNFISSLDKKPREKVLYNIWKSRIIGDSELLKKLLNEIWEFRTQYQGIHIRLLCFWDKNSKQPKLVICTNGFIKKGWKVPKKEIDKAFELMNKYYEL